MSKIGLVVAMEVEAKILIEKLSLVKIDEINSVYIQKNVSDKYASIVLIVSGIGMENSAIATQFLIFKYGVNSILNFGYVGSNNIEIGLVVSPNKVYNIDFDLIVMGYDKYKIPGINDLVINSIQKYMTCTCYSANHFVLKSDEVDSVIYDMELHGIAMVCIKYNIPLYSIKVVTDCLNADKYNESERDISFSEVLSNEVEKYINK